MDLAPYDFRAMWRAASRACGGLGLAAQDVEDCAQAAFVAYCCLSADESARIGDPARWVATVARHRAIDDLRRRDARRRAEAAFGRRCPDVCPDVSDAVEAAVAARALVEGLLRELPPATVRAVCALSDGCTAAEAACRLGTTARSVESHRYRARRHLAPAGAPA